MKLLTGGIRDKKAKAYLSERYTLVGVPSLPVADPIREHIDIGLFVSGSISVCEPSVYGFYKEFFPSVICAGTRVSEKYPKDVAYNAFSVCGALVCREDATDVTLKSIFPKIVSVRQGYAKCSTVVVSENAVITSDRSIFSACEKLGADTLFADNDGVLLEGYDTGFLGGATAVTDEYVLFIGDLSRRKDCKEICSFIEAHGKKVEYIPDVPLLDCGSPVII